MTDGGDADADGDADGDTDGDADSDADDETDGDVCDPETEIVCGPDGNLWWADCEGDRTSIFRDCVSEGASCLDGECCTEETETRCVDNAVYYFDSCGNQGDLIENCETSGQVCRNDSQCCLSQADRRCQGDLLRWYDSCGNPEAIDRDCAEESARCIAGQCCASQASSQCVDGDLMWLDGCGNVESLREACDDGLDCTDDSCITSEGGCVHEPDCSASECQEALEACQCNVVSTPLACGGTATGSLAPGSDTTDLFDSYGLECNWTELSDPDGNEMTFRFSLTGTRSMEVAMSIECSCSMADQAYAIVLDGSFAPCDPTQCVASQSRDAPI